MSAFLLNTAQQAFILRTMHGIQYRLTGQGTRTRSHLLQYLHPQEERSREDLSQRSGLTYEQVRRQTRNLSIEGAIVSRTVRGKRFYRLK